MLKWLIPNGKNNIITFVMGPAGVLLHQRKSNRSEWSCWIFLYPPFETVGGCGFSKTRVELGPIPVYRNIFLFSFVSVHAAPQLRRRGMWWWSEKKRHNFVLRIFHTFQQPKTRTTTTIRLHISALTWPWWTLGGVTSWCHTWPSISHASALHGVSIHWR